MNYIHAAKICLSCKGHDLKPDTYVSVNPYMPSPNRFFQFYDLLHRSVAVGPKIFYFEYKTFELHIKYHSYEEITEKKNIEL